MKKLIFSAALVLSLGLAACGEVEEISDENVNASSAEETSEEPVKEEVKEEAKEEPATDENVTESEVGKMTTIYQNKELNIPIESGTIKGNLSKVRLATLETADTYKEIFGGDVVSIVTVEMQVENTTDATVSFYPNQATLVTDTGQQVDADLLFSDDIGGDFLGAVKKEGNVQWVLKHDENVKKVTLHIGSAHDENFSNLGDDLKIEIPFE